LHVIPGIFSVARPGLKIFDEQFNAEFFCMPLPQLAAFIFRNGTKVTSAANSARVSGGSSTLETRIEFGCAGLHNEPNASGGSRPASLVGTNVFISSEDKVESELLRVLLGRIVDKLAVTSAHLCSLLQVPIGNNFRRFSEYASHLRLFLFSSELLCEWVTVSLQNLSVGETGVEHYDSSNDSRQGYNRVECFSIIFVDGVGDCWNLKVIVSWRLRVGDYLTIAVSNFLRIKSRFRMMIAEIDGKFVDLLGRYTGATV
jgi:hypothetical protein